LINNSDLKRPASQNLVTLNWQDVPDVTNSSGVEGERHLVWKGFMQKQGGSYKSWKVRFFELKDGTCVYWSTTSKGVKKEEKGKVSMSEVTGVDVSKKQRVPHCLDLITAKRTYKFACVGDKEMYEWIRAFKSWI